MSSIEINSLTKSFGDFNAVDDITLKIESGEIGLEESVQLYEEGMKIKKICDNKLKDIEMQIKKIMIEDNKVTKEDF